jgi:hypothetical protein
MDLVNQDMKVREELKEAYLQNRSTGNVKTISNPAQLQQQYSRAGRQYLLDEPSGNEVDLPNLDNINLISNKHETKWPIGFLPQMLILFFTLFSINW